MSIVGTPWRGWAAPPASVVRTRLRTARARIRRRPIILMYHRVADAPIDPWGLAVLPHHFEQHVHVLRRSGRPVLTLRQLADSIRAGDPVRRAVVLTFDDGYADNTLVARPTLERAEVPATVFVTTDAIDSPREMWWDELERIILTTPTLPGSFDVDIDGERVTGRLDAGGPIEAGWTVGDHTSSMPRQALYLALWNRLSRLPGPSQRAVLDELAAWADVDLSPRGSHRMVTSDEFDQLAGSELIEIGSHTVTHPDLRNSHRVREELSDSKAELERRTGQPVTSFAYPSGQHDQGVAAAVAAAGYRAAVTTRSAPVSERDDPHLLPRFLVADQDGSQFARFIAALG